MVEGALKIFNQTLTSIHPRIGALNHPSCFHYHKARFSLRLFFVLRQFGRTLETNLPQDIWIDLLQSSNNGLNMIAMIQQDGDFGTVDRFFFEVVNVGTEHLNEPNIIGYIRWGAMGEEGKA